MKPGIPTFAALLLPLLAALPHPVLARGTDEPTGFAPIYLNVGGGEIEWNGKPWRADSFFGAGSQAFGDSAQTPSGVQAPYQGTVYETQRYAHGDLTYAIPVPPGRYDVELHFAEIWHPAGSVGARVFDVGVEERTIAEAVDVTGRAEGDIDTPLVLSAQAVDPGASGSPGQLDLRIGRVTDATVLNAIVVRCAEGADCAWVPVTAPAGSEDDAGPILSAVNLAGTAMTYGGIDFAPDADSATGRTGEEGSGGNDGPNGRQEGLVGTPFASVRWDREVSYSGEAPAGPVTVDLYFMEGWWPDAGRRVMAIEIEGEILREGFDIVAASKGDFNTPQVLRFTGIDPAKSGDPNRVELRVIGQKDVAVLSAVVLRCEGDAETCAQRAAEAEEERLAAAAAAAEAERLRWQGLWRANYSETQRSLYDRSVTTRNYTVNLVSTAEGAHLIIRLKNLECTAAFEAGPRPEEMTPIGFTCPYAPNLKITDMRLESGKDGGIRVAYIVNGRPWGIDMPKEIGMPILPSTAPEGFPFETAGLTLEPDLATQKAAVEARLESRGLAAAWETEELGGGLYRHFSNEPKSFLNYEGEHYQIFSYGKGEDAIPVGLIRRWMPAPSAQPLHETLVEALRARYGPETVAQIYDRGFGERYLLGLNWIFDRDGRRRSAACDGPVAYNQALRYLPGQNYSLTGSIPTYATWRFGCGLHLQVTHSVPRPNQPLKAMQATLIDSAPLERALWETYASDLTQRIEKVKKEAKADAAEQEEAESVQPDL